MTLLISKEQSFYITSSVTGTTLPDNSIITPDGTIVASDRSTVFINLNSPGITVPTGAVEIAWKVESASLWHTAPNISQALNNNRIDYIYNGVQQPHITIPDGLYSVDDLNAFVSRELVNRGELADGLVFSGSESTQKVVITVNKYYQIDLTNFSSIRSVIGWNSQIYPTVMPVVITSKSGENQAKFNNINEFTIRSDLVSEGIRVNNSGRNLLAVIPIPEGSANSQVVYQPNHPSVIEAGEFRGKSINNYYVSICDERGLTIPQSEPWTVLLVLSYKYILTSEVIPLIDL